MRDLADKLRISLSTASRLYARLEGIAFSRQRNPLTKRYHYTLFPAFRPSWKPKEPAPEPAPDSAVAPVQVHVAQRATQEVSLIKNEERRARARVREPDSEAGKWRHKVRWWLRNPKAKMAWLPNDGPPPDQPDTWVPQIVLDELSQHESSNIQAPDSSLETVSRLQSAEIRPGLCNPHCKG